MVYIEEYPKWDEILKNKHIIVDTDFFIDVLKYGAEAVFDRFEELGIKLCTIHLVKTELLRTQKPKDRVAIQKLLSERDVFEMPLIGEEFFQNVEKVQEKLATYDTYPSPTDLYLGAVISIYDSANTLLLTANIKDFPRPLFHRETYLMLQSDKKIKPFAFFSLNKDEL